MTRIIYLGQAGLLFESRCKKIMIDPYLSDGVAKFEPKNKRRIAVDETFFSEKPDVLIITHNHGDHYDKETFSRFVNEKSAVKVLCPYSVWCDARKIGGDNHFILFDAGTSVTADGFVFTAVKAVHSDVYSIGVIITIDNENFYITGDTLYSEKVFASLPDIKFKCVFLPINGVGNNMNANDAVRFINRLDVEYAVPMHFGLFDTMNGSELKTEKSRIPKIYKEIVLNESN